MSNLRNNIFALLILQGSNYLIPLITYPYLSRVLDVVGVGKYGVILSIIQYLTMFIDFGFNLTSTKRIATSRDKQQITSVFWATMFCKFILYLISCIIVLVIFINSDTLKIDGAIIFAVVQLFGVVIFPVWFFQGIEKLQYVTLCTVFSRALILPFIFLFVQSEDDLWVAIFIQSLTYISCGIVAIVFIYKLKVITKFEFKATEIFNSFRDSMPIYVGNVAISLYTLSTPLIINYFSNGFEVGLYSSADKIRSAAMGCMLILGNAIYPRVNRLFKEDRKKAFKFIQKVFFYQCAISLIIVLFFMITSGLVTNILLGDSFMGAELIVKIMSPLYLFIPLSVIFCNYILLPLGYQKEYVVLPLITALIHIFVCSYLSYSYGAIGGAIAIVVSELFTVMAFLYILNKNNLISWIWGGYEV